MEVQAPRSAPDHRSPHRQIPGLRSEVAHDFAAAYARDPYPSQQDRLELLAGWLLRARHSAPGVVRRPVRDIVRVLGLEFDGTVRDARRRHRSSLARAMDQLEEMGWVRSWGATYKPNGEGECWEIVLGSPLTSPRSSVDRATDF